MTTRYTKPKSHWIIITDPGNFNLAEIYGAKEERLDEAEEIDRNLLSALLRSL